MAVKNIIDNTSTTVSANTPGWTIDLRAHSTRSRASFGVPVRFKICVNTTVANDGGFVQLVDSTGTPMIVIPTTGTGTQWYTQDGWLPETLAKYDLQYGAGAAGTITPLAMSLYELHNFAPYIGALSKTLDALTLSSTGTIVTVSYGDAALTVDALTLSATGFYSDTGSLSSTLADLTLSATGTITASPPVFQSQGSAAFGTSGTVSPAWGTHATDDRGYLIVVQVSDGVGAADPGAATLTDAQGFSSVLSIGGSYTSVSTRYIRLTVFEAKATSSSMAAPTVAAVGSGSRKVNAAAITAIRGCTTSGSAVDVSSSSTNNASDTSFSVAGATTTVASTLVLVCAGADRGNAVSGVSFASWANSDLSSVTEREDETNTTSTGIAATTGGKATAGAYGNTTATIDNASLWAGITLALKP